MKKLMLSVALSGLMLIGVAQEKKVERKAGERIEHRMQKNRKDMASKSPEELAKAKTDRMDAKLKFTDKQRKEVYAFQLNQAKKHKKVYEERKAAREKALADRKADQDKFMKILTPEQQKTWKDSYVENHKGRKGHFRKGGEMRKREHRKEDVKPTLETTKVS